jgi:hypothetical protein
MADGSLRRCDEIRAGDKVHGGAVVKCVVQTMCGESQQQSLVRLSATMRATPWHPVCINGKWTFPIHVAPVRNEHCTATWNYVLSAGHEMIVGGIKCATLGEEKGKFLAAFCLLSPNFKATESSTSRETFARRPIGDETSSKTWRKCQGSRWEWWSFTSRKL